MFNVACASPSRQRLGAPGWDTKKVALRRSGNCCRYMGPYLPAESTSTNSTFPRLSSIMGHDLRHTVTLAPQVLGAEADTKSTCVINTMGQDQSDAGLEDRASETAKRQPTQPSTPQPLPQRATHVHRHAAIEGRKHTLPNMPAQYVAGRSCGDPGMQGFL